MPGGGRPLFVAVERLGGPLGLGDRVVQGQIGLPGRALTSHQVVRVVRHEELRGVRDIAAGAVLGAGDPAQVLVQREQFAALLGQQPLQLPGAGVLPGGGTAAGLVPLRRRRGVLVKASHLGAGAGPVGGGHRRCAEPPTASTAHRTGTSVSRVWRGRGASTDRDPPPPAAPACGRHPGARCPVRRTDAGPNRGLNEGLATPPSYRPRRPRSRARTSCPRPATRPAA